jgi:hypothetical protein
MPQFLIRDEVKQAHISGSYAIAYEAAAEELDGLPFNAGFELVLAAAAGEDDLYYDALALWWLHRAIVERRFTLYHAGWAAQRLHDMREWRQRGSAEMSLRRLLD